MACAIRLRSLYDDKPSIGFQALIAAPRLSSRNLLTNPPPASFYVQKYIQSLLNKQPPGSERAAVFFTIEEEEMKNTSRLLASALFAAILLGTGFHLQAQTHPAAKPLPAASATPPTDQEVADTQEQLIKLLRLSPTLTTVVAHDPSLLADQEYVQRNNPELAQFLAAHPQVPQNPDFYLFSRLDPRGGRRDQVLERAVWPEFQEQPRDQSALPQVIDQLVPIVVVPVIFFSLVWVIRIFVESLRWSKTFKMQSDVHARLIEKFSSSQELSAYMETEAGKRFLEAAPPQKGFSGGQHMPNAVARVLTPLQVGIVMVLLGLGFIMLRHAQTEMNVPMLVLGTVLLMPGIGFILSAGAAWLVARRLGLMPESPAALKRADSA